MNRWFYHVPILGYHRVGPYKGDHVPTISAQAFERQLSFLARFHHQVLSLSQLAESLDRSERMPRHAAVITFDDGYEETHSVAWPLLKRFGFPATVFVTPSEVGTPGFMTWEQLRALSADGFTVGSHTMHHSYLPLVDARCLPEELVQSKRVIEEQIGRPAEFLSYPVGGFTAAVQTLAEQAGYRAACTTNRILTDRSLDRYALRRIKITERDAHPLLFGVKLSGHYDAFRQLKHSS
jgi:peptidoglycan/xylan/chitin deacetylase (PgdA/CDA1 family)